MIVQEPVQAAIWHCLNHYAYVDAIFLAERLYAEVGSEEALFLLATCYYRSGKSTRAYSLLHTCACHTPQCKYLLARCCLDLNKLSEAEAALVGGSVVKCKSPDDLASEFGDIACFATQLLARICGRTERLGKAAESYRKSLKLNPFLWSSYESLCNLGEKPDPTKVFELSHLDSLNSCQGTNLLVQLVNQGDSSTGFATESEVLNENNMTPMQPQSISVVVTSSPSLACTTYTPECIQEDKTSDWSLFPTLPTNQMRAPRNKLYGQKFFKGPMSLSPLTPSFGILSVESGSPIECSYPMAFIMTHSTPSLIDSQVNDGKSPGKKQPIITRRSQTLNLAKPSVFSQSGNTSNLTLSPAPSPPQSGLQPSTMANVPRRSSRLFSSSNSVKENNKSSSKTRFTSPKTPTRKAKTRSSKSSLSQASFNELNELNKPETVDTENKNNSISTAQQALGTQKAAADGLMHLLQELGKAYLHLAHYNCRKAIELFSNLSPNQLNTGWVLCSLGRAHFELGEYQQAVQLFSEVRRLEPHRLEGLELYSTALWHLQREVELSTLAQDLTEFDKESPETWCATGNCFSLQKEHDIAIKFFLRATQVDPNFAYAYTLLGHEYVTTEELDKAMTCFRNAIRIDSRHYNAWYGVGMIFYKQEKFQLAEVHFKKALATNPQSSVLMCHIGVVQHALQKTDAALTTLNRAIAADPKNPLCKFHRASIYFANDRHQEALHELNELKEIVPKESLVYFLIGKVHKKLGNTHLALMNFSWAMDLDPKGANNQIKEAIDRRYANDDDELSVNHEKGLEESNNPDLAEIGERESSHASSVMDAEDMQLQAMESDESL